MCDFQRHHAVSSKHYNTYGKNLSTRRNGSTHSNQAETGTKVWVVAQVGENFVDKFYHGVADLMLLQM